MAEWNSTDLHGHPLRLAWSAVLVADAAFVVGGAFASARGRAVALICFLFAMDWCSSHGLVRQTPALPATPAFMLQVCCYQYNCICNRCSPDRSRRDSIGVLAQARVIFWRITSRNTPQSAEVVAQSSGVVVPVAADLETAEQGMPGISMQTTSSTHAD